MKRIMDVFFALLGLAIASPILLIFMLLVWLQDRHSPFYIAHRVGKDGKIFNMVKLRSMAVNADRNGVTSTSATDARITRVGHMIRRYKLDELTQLWNVLLGDMSLVGPRPQVKCATDMYTDIERQLLDIRPGITDFSSIVFADEGEILMGKLDPDLSYEQLIRPWKSRLGLFYIETRTVILDVWLCILTVVAIVSRRQSLRLLSRTLEKLGAGEQLVRVATRQEPLVPAVPPGKVPS